MKDIKFRLWDHEELKMISWDQIKASGFYVSMLVTWPNLCQYTGLKDKNDKEIYEGDILSGDKLYGFDGIYNGDIRYIPCRYQLFVKYPEGGYGGIILDKDEVMEHSLTVIGNVYENPELLES